MPKAVPRHIILIGMPGSGKSTLGAELSKRLGRSFIDSDQLIEQSAGLSLQRLLDHRGPDAFAAIEEQIGLHINPEVPSVIATGGSMVYSEAAMNHLASIGLILFIDVPLERLERRVGNGRDRGLLNRTDGGLADMFRERLPLYQRHARLTVHVDAGTPDDHLEHLLACLESGSEDSANGRSGTSRPV